MEHNLIILPDSTAPEHNLKYKLRRLRIFDCMKFCVLGSGVLWQMEHLVVISCNVCCPLASGEG